MRPYRKVIVLGLDGFEPRIVDRLLRSGDLPNIAALRDAGGYSRLATTHPAQTPVAWSTFATGLNPGGHGIFDFLRRDPRTYTPDLALTKFEQRSALLPATVVNLRGGRTIWDTLTENGVSSTVLRCPCTYPASRLKGRLLSGMGVPDVRGGLGTATLFTTGPQGSPLEGEQVVSLRGDASHLRGELPGPRHVGGSREASVAVTLDLDNASSRATLRVQGCDTAVTMTVGSWSEWLPVRFRLGRLTSMDGIVRFLLLRLDPFVELYASPVNFDPRNPPFPISHPWEYGRELTQEIGLFHTAGIVEDHTGLANDRLNEDDFLAQCDDVLREREAMMRFELGRLREGLFYVLFDTPDRIQHMFWRYNEPDHPAHQRDDAARYLHVIDDHYRRCDAIVGEAMRAADHETLVIVLSDHGFGSFQRSVHLNTWLVEHGWMHLRPGVQLGDNIAGFLHGVDWSRTRAYALGIGSLYLNVAGREGEGIIAPSSRRDQAHQLAAALSELEDVERGVSAINRVHVSDEIYSGPFMDIAPDLVVDFATGYRASWETALGGTASSLIEDNRRKWSGDHIVDPALVPGVLLMNQPFRQGSARMLDLAPTILRALGVEPPVVLEGESLLA